MYDPLFDFPKADAVERGCGEREPGGVYAESGLSNHGLPLEAFLMDPPLPIPAGLDLINKPQLWQRVLPSGDPVLDLEERPIYDLLIWVGQEHYEYAPDYLEEVRRYGASRKLNPNLDLSLLSSASRMILAHPCVINTLWQEQRPPQVCGKHVPGHDGNPPREDTAVREEDEWDEEEMDDEDEGEQEATWHHREGGGWDEEQVGQQGRAIVLAHPNLLATLPAPPMFPFHMGPCLFKLWELIPQNAAETVITLDGEERPLCLRRIGSTTYQYQPTGESADGLVPGLFAALPITGFALIRFADGIVNEKAKQKILSGMEVHGTRALPFYESDR